jgi:hypothetical protein
MFRVGERERFSEKTICLMTHRFTIPYLVQGYRHSTYPLDFNIMVNFMLQSDSVALVEPLLQSQ